MTCYLVTFASVHHALRARRVLRQVGVEALLLPTPRDIDVSCGHCLEVPAVLARKVLMRLQEAGVPWSGIYRPLGPRQYEKISAAEV